MEGRKSVLAAVEGGSMGVFDAIRRLDSDSGTDEARRKNSGVVYTPEWIARSMAALAGAAPGVRVLEPSCGRGVFAFALAERYLALVGSAPDAADALAGDLVLSELDGEAAADFLGLWRAFWSARGVSDAPAPEVHVGDTLSNGFDGRTFDLALGNPPYVRFQNLPPATRERLKAEFSSCASGNVDLYHAFVEFCLRKARRTCLVVPNSWLSTKSGAELRRLLRPKLTRLVDFGQRLVFAPTRAYACILVAEDAPAGPVLLGTDPAADIPFPTERERTDPMFDGGRWHVFPKTEDCGKTIGSLAQVRSGIATLSDATFKILQDGPIEDGRVFFQDQAAGIRRSVPERFAPRLVKLTKTPGPAAMLAPVRVLCPYGEDGRLVLEGTLEQEAPDLLAYLRARRAVLDARDRGDTSKHEAWFAYGRRQGLSPLPKTPLVGLAGMSKDGLRPFVFDPEVVGRFLFTSGFILEPKEGVDVERLLEALVNPRLWEWMLANGKEWASPEGSYRSYGARLLTSAPAFS